MLLIPQNDRGAEIKVEKSWKNISFYSVGNANVCFFLAIFYLYVHYSFIVCICVYFLFSARGFLNGEKSHFFCVCSADRTIEGKNEMYLLLNAFLWDRERGRKKYIATLLGRQHFHSPGRQQQPKKKEEDFIILNSIIVSTGNVTTTNQKVPPRADML